MGVACQHDFTGILSFFPEATISVTLVLTGSRLIYSQPQLRIIHFDRSVRISLLDKTVAFYGTILSSLSPYSAMKHHVFYH